MQNLQHYLFTMGITDEEGQVYINALETGASTVLEYAQNTAIPRTTVYLLVESLINKGLLTETIEGKRKKYVPASPQELISLAKEKEMQFKMTAEALEKEKSILDALYNRKEGKPRIEYKEGKKAVEEIFKLSLSADQIYMFFTSIKGREILGDIGEIYYDAYMKQMIPTKQIIRNTDKNKTYLKEEGTNRNQIVLIDESYASETDYLIFNNSVVFITYKSTIPQVTILEDERIAYLEKMRYNLLFNSLKPQIEK